MSPTELIREVEDRGGFVALALDGKNLCVRLPNEGAESLSAQLRSMKPEVIALLRQRTVVNLDVPCTCDEKPYPHFRHIDGTGPGSGRRLEPCNPRQAHGRRR